MNEPLIPTRGLLLVPLIGASDSLVNALGLWLTWALIILGYGVAMALVRPRLAAYQRLIAAIVLATTLTVCMDLVVQAWALTLHRSLSLYIALAALSCLALEYEGFFSERRLPERIRLGGLSALWMISLGALRELVGSGAVGHHLPWLAGLTDSTWQGWRLLQDGIPLALLAPGGFILLGLLLAARRTWSVAKPHCDTEETPRS